MRTHSSRFFLLSKFSFGLAAAILLGVVGLHGHAHLAEASPNQAPPSPKQRTIAQIVQAQPSTVSALKTAEPEVAATPVPAPVPAPTPPPEPPELAGNIGYARAGGNCVNEPGINNPGYGNPSGWPVTSATPSIGATAVFTWNHVGVVTGIWRNGDIEVRHQNYWGGQHRFPASMIRGYR